MNRIFAWLFVTFCLALLAAPAHCRAQYYGADTARTLTERLQSVGDFPVGHPRLYDLQGYEGYQPYSATPLDSARHRQARQRQPEIGSSGVKEEQVLRGTARTTYQRTSESKRHAFEGFLLLTVEPNCEDDEVESPRSQKCMDVPAVADE